jgi:hypothetical protein
MIIISKPEDISKNSICIGEKIKNNISGYKYFYPLYLVYNHFTLKNIYFTQELYDFQISMYFNKYKITFNDSNPDNFQFIQFISDIERNALKSISIQDKTPYYTLYEQISRYNFKINIEEQIKINQSLFNKSKNNNKKESRFSTESHSLHNFDFNVLNTYINNKSCYPFPKAVLLIRFSGIWENNTNYGLIYKLGFIHLYDKNTNLSI